MQAIHYHDTKPNLFDVPELMFHVLSYLNWESLVAIGHTNRAGRVYMKSCMRDIIIGLLIGYFVSHPTCIDFLHKLENIGGVITGSSTLLLLLYGRDHGQGRPNNLNIVVPFGHKEPLVNFLTATNFVGRERKATKMYEKVAHSCSEYVHVHSKKIVIVTESTTKDVLRVILDGHTTSTMNVLTIRNFIAFYPRLARNGLAFTGFSIPSIKQHADVAKWGISLTDASRTTNHVEPCRPFECPSPLRRVFGLRGIGLVQWSNENEANQIEDHPIAWRLGPFCQNKYCFQGAKIARLLSRTAAHDKRY